MIFSPVNEWHAIAFASHKADTFVTHQWCPLYRDSIVASQKTRWVQPKILVLIINFFSLNFLSIEIEGESSSQNERTLGWGVLENEQGQTRGRGGQNSGIMRERTFWMSPKCISFLTKWLTCNSLYPIKVL